MPSKRDENPAKRAVINECQRMVRRIATLLAPDATSRKNQYNTVARVTGLPPRRLKDFWHGYLQTIPAHQEKTIRSAYLEALRLWKERALQQFELIEAEHAELSRDAVGYSAARWDRAVKTRTRVGALGQAAPSTDND